MDAKRTTAAFGENVEVAAGLRSFYGPERIFLARDGEIESVVAGDLQKDAAVRTAFISLAGGVQKARAEAEAGGDFLFVADDVAKLLQDFFVFRVHRNVAENGEVISGSRSGAMFFQHLH